MSQAFDRATALLGMPEVRSTRPTTITEHNAILGHTGTHVVQTACSFEEEVAPDGKERRIGKLTIFLQVIDEGSVTQVVLPDRVCRAMLRQMRSASARPKRQPTKEEIARK